MAMPGERDIVGPLPDADFEPGEWRWRGYCAHLEDLGYDLAGGTEEARADSPEKRVLQGAS